MANVERLIASGINFICGWCGGHTNRMQSYGGPKHHGESGCVESMKEQNLVLFVLVDET